MVCVFLWRQRREGSCSWLLNGGDSLTGASWSYDPWAGSVKVLCSLLCPNTTRLGRWWWWGSLQLCGCPFPQFFGLLVFYCSLHIRNKTRLGIKKGKRAGPCWRKWHDAHTENEAQSASGWEVGSKMNECPKSDGNNPVRLEKKKVSSNRELPFSRQPDLEVFTWTALLQQVKHFVFNRECMSR